MKLRLPFLLIVLGISFAASTQTIPKWKITQLEQLMEESNDVLVINFWATFCVPCIEEIPDLVRYAGLYKKNKVQLYLVSLDLPSYYPGKIRKFVQQQKIKNKVVWLQETNADYFCPKIDSSWSGAIPATLFYHKKTGYKKFFEKKLTPAEIESTIKEAIQE